jgi:hypothetical protein
VIADFIKVVLPDATLTQIVDTSKRETAELGTQPVQYLPTQPPLPSTSSVGEVVYEKQKSHVSTRFAVPLQLPLMMMMRV